MCLIKHTFVEKTKKMVHHSRLPLLTIDSEIVQSLTTCDVNGFSKDIGGCVKEKGAEISAKM